MKCPFRNKTTSETTVSKGYTGNCTTTTTRVEFEECYYSECPWYDQVEADEPARCACNQVLVNESN